MLGEKPAEAALFSQVHLTARARQNIYHAGDPLARIPVICEGYAFRFVQLPDGRRQILSFILPGESIWGGAFLRSNLLFSLQTITKVRYCAFDRAEIARAISLSPSFTAGIAKHCISEGVAAHHTIVNLGRRSAEERVAQLLLDFTRQQNTSAGQIGKHAFPLKQVHIADAVGLTQIHVSRVLNRLKRAGILSLEEGLLTVLDQAALVRIAERGLTTV